jgi:hypothetical protein
VKAGLERDTLARRRDPICGVLWAYACALLPIPLSSIGSPPLGLSHKSPDGSCEVIAGVPKRETRETASGRHTLCVCAAS